MKIKLYCSGLSYQVRPNAVIAPEQYQLPRLALARLNQSFLPDYSLLLLAGSIVMDRRTFDELVRGLIPSPGGLVLAVKSLHDAGLVELVDFEKTFSKVKPDVLQALDADLMAFKDWEASVAQSVENWRTYSIAVQENLRPKVQRLRQMATRTGLDYSDLASNYLHDLAGRIQMIKFFAEDALPSPNPTVEVLPDSELFVNHLREHLLSAHYTVAAARQLKAGVHEWVDAAPYYSKVLGPDTPAAPVFELPLPEFSLWHPDRLVKAMTSKAANDLRELASGALLNGEPWSDKAAQKCLMAIVKIDQGMPSVRRVSACRKAGGSAGTKTPVGSRKASGGEWFLTSDALGARPAAAA